MATTSTPQKGDLKKPRIIRQKLRQHLGKIAILVAASVALMTAYVLFRAKEYTAYAQILIERSEIGVDHLVEENAENLEPPRSEELEIELKRVASTLTLHEVIEAFEPAFNEPLLDTIWARLQAFLSIGERAPKDVAGSRTFADHMNEFRQRLVIKRDPSLPVILVGYRSVEPEHSAEVANAIAQAYLQKRTTGQRENVKKAIDDLARVADELSISVRKAEQETADYQAEADLYAVDGILPVEQRYNRLSKELTEAALDVTDAKALMLEAEEGAIDAVSPGPIDDLQGSSLIDKLRAENTESGQRAQGFDYSLENATAFINGNRVEPRVERAPSPLDEARLIDQYRTTVRATEIRYQELEKQIQTTKAELSRSRDNVLHLRELEQRVVNLKQSHPAMQKRLLWLRARANQVANSARIIEPATPPSKPSNPNGFLLIGMAFMGSCVAGMGLAALSRPKHHGFGDTAETERELGHPVLGMLPRVSGIVPVDTDLEISSQARQWSLESYSFLEGVRSILNTILPNNRGDGPGVGKVVMMTSCFPNEGKTTFALSLIRQAALAGAKSVFVEGDMRKAGLAARLRTVRPGKSLADVLRGTIAEVDDALVQEPESGADLLLAAGPHDDAFALSRSSRMKMVINDLRKRYDLVIVDCPPILGVSDTRAICDLADEILFVVRWQETHQAIVKSAIRDLERGKLPVTGVVMTQVDLAKHLKGNGASSYGYQESYEAYRPVGKQNSDK